MKRHIAAALSALALMTGIGWKLAHHPEPSVGLQDISLKQHSEHSQKGPSNGLAGIRIRLSPRDFNREATSHVPQIPVAVE
jgi:hypothetical protein